MEEFNSEKIVWISVLMFSLTDILIIKKQLHLILSKK